MRQPRDGGDCLLGSEEEEVGVSIVRDNGPGEERKKRQAEDRGRDSLEMRKVGRGEVGAKGATRSWGRREPDAA